MAADLKRVRSKLDSMHRRAAGTRREQMGLFLATFDSLIAERDPERRRMLGRYIRRHMVEVIAKPLRGRQ